MLWGAGLNSLSGHMWPQGLSLFTSVEYYVKYLVPTLLCIDQTHRLGLCFLLRSLRAPGFVPFLYKSKFQNRIGGFLTLGPREQGEGGAEGCGVVRMRKVIKECQGERESNCVMYGRGE